MTSLNDVLQNNNTGSQNSKNPSLTSSPIKSLLMSPFSKQESATQQLNKQLLKEAQQRRQENYEKLKEWDRKRQQVLGLHRQTIDQLIKQIERRVRKSQDYQQTLYRFLIDRYEQKKQYASHPLKDPTCQTNPAHLITDPVYSNSSGILHHCYQISLQRQQKFRQLTDRVNRSLFQPLQNDTNEVELQITVARERLKALKQQMQERNMQASQRCSELAERYKERTTNIFRSQYDLYTLQQQFIQSAREQTNTQKKMGNQAISFLQIAISAELKRSKVIKKELRDYFQLMKQLAEIDLMSLQSSQQLQKNEEQPLIREFYSVDDMFNHERHEKLRVSLGMKTTEPVDLNILKTYLQNLPFQFLDSQKLVLKKISCYCKTEDGKLQQVTLTITVDAFAHLHLDKKPEESPEFSFKLRPTIQLKHHSDIELQIIIESVSQSRLRFFYKDNRLTGFSFHVFFRSQKQKQDFCQLINSIVQ